nr:hypothetical protein [Tanacetum cinerariifolium]
MNQNFFEPNLCYEPNSSSFDQYHSSQSFVAQQFPQRSNEDIRLKMAKLIKNNRILLNNNDFPHEETKFLPQFLNDSRTIKQAANLAVQQKKEEQADYEEMIQDREKFIQGTQIFLEKFNRYSFGVTPRVLSIAWERISNIKYVFTKPEQIPELMCKLLEDVRNIREELVVYINSLSWNRPTFFDNDEEDSILYKEYLEKSSDAITPILPTEEPEYSLSMRYEHLSTTPETESDEVIESSAKNLLPIPSEYEVTSDDESECDVPVTDESSLVFMTFSNPLFNGNDDFTSSDDESLSDEDVPTKKFKVYSNPLFDDEEINSDEIDPHCFNAESDFVESLSNRDTVIDSSLKFDFLKEFSGAFMPNSIADEERIRREHEKYISLMEILLTINPCPRQLENFHANTVVKTLSTSPIQLEDSDSQREEIDIFTGTDDLLTPSIENNDYDSEEDIHVLKELLVDDSISLSKNESFYFDHQDDLSFPLPPPEPPDVKFDFEPNLGEVISAINELNEDECFDPGGEIDVSKNVENDDYFPFMFVIELFYRISSTLRILLYLSPLGVKTLFLTLASLFRASGISLGWNFHILLCLSKF